MKYLSEEQLKALPQQRLKALLATANAKVGKRIDPYFDFIPETLSPDETELNDYRKTIRGLLRK